MRPDADAHTLIPNLQYRGTGMGDLMLIHTLIPNLQYRGTGMGDLMLMHWCILQKVSKMQSLAFSMKSALHATRKKSPSSTYKYIRKHYTKHCVYVYLVVLLNNNQYNYTVELP